MNIFSKLVIVTFLTMFLLACGTLDNKTNQLAVGDSKDAVLNLMGTPDNAQSQGRQDVLKYCVSGSSFGSNDHKDIFFTDGRLTKINAYSSAVTGCRNAIKPYVLTAPREEFSLHKAKEVCGSLGFKAGTESMSNCLLTQQLRNDRQGEGFDAAKLEEKRLQTESANRAAENQRQLMDALTTQTKTTTTTTTTNCSGTSNSIHCTSTER